MSWRRPDPRSSRRARFTTWLNALIRRALGLPEFPPLVYAYRFWLANQLIGATLVIRGKNALLHPSFARFEWNDYGANSQVAVETERLPEELIEEPEPPGPDHPRPIHVSTPFPSGLHTRAPMIRRRWVAGDAARCKLCSVGCAAQRDAQSGQDECLVVLPLELASKPIDVLALFRTRTPDYHKHGRGRS